MKKFRKINNFILFLLPIIAIYLAILEQPYIPLHPFSDHVKGSQDANITVLIYGEYQCFRTRNFWNEILPKLEQDYISTGEVKFIYRYHPKSFFNYSVEAAEATECAADQGKFWEYISLIFQRTDLTCDDAGKGVGINISDLNGYAKELGLNMKLFDACLDSGAMMPRIQADIQELHKTGLRASGVVFINGELISGNRPYTEFQSLIEKQLHATV